MKLEARELSFSYTSGSGQVLNNVSFDVKGGENTVILGVNGEGKTTLLKCLCGILKPTSGECLFDGKSIEKMKGSERAERLAYVPQLPVFPDISVFETVLSGRRASFTFKPSKADRERAADALTAMGIEKLASKSAKMLSGGEQRKVAVARALCSEAKLMLMDEPAASLDVGGALHLTEEIKKISRERNITFLVTMHDISLALRFADKIILLKDGAVCGSGGAEILTPEIINKIYGIQAHIYDLDGTRILVPDSNMKG